jgi:hypothetical protein
MMFRLNAHHIVHRRLDSGLIWLDSMMQQGRITNFFNNSDSAGALSRLLKDIGHAIMEYQVNVAQTRSLVYSDVIAIDGLTTSHLQKCSGSSLLFV